MSKEPDWIDEGGGTRIEFPVEATFEQRFIILSRVYFAMQGLQQARLFHRVNVEMYGETAFWLKYTHRIRRGETVSIKPFSVAIDTVHTIFGQVMDDE